MQTHIIFFALSLNFSGSFVNDTLSILKLNVLIITRFICSNKYVKQVVLINHNWIFPTLPKEWGPGFYLLSKNWGESTFFSEIGKGW